MQSLPLTPWVWILLKQGVLDTLCDKVRQWLAAGQWFSQGMFVSSNDKIDRRDIAEILLKVVLNTITHPPDNPAAQKKIVLTKHSPPVVY